MPRRRDGLAPSRHAHDQRDHEQDEEEEEQDLRDAGRRRSDAAKTENRGDDRHDKEDKGPREHGILRINAWEKNADPYVLFRSVRETPRPFATFLRRRVLLLGKAPIGELFGEAFKERGAIVFEIDIVGVLPHV